MNKLILAVLLLMYAATSWAINLDQAKAQGLVGEGNRGYLGYVVAPTNAVKSLVQGINKKRKAQFSKIATDTGATIGQVEIRFYQRARKAASKGHYIQDGSGKWVKK